MSWDAAYYHDTDLSGNPVVERTDDAINIASEDDLPQEVKDRPPLWVSQLKRMHTKTEWFSVRWKKSINGPGRFRFSCTTDDGMRIKLDGQTIINEWRDQGATDYSAERQLSAGPHEVIVEYYQGGGGFRAYVNIERIGGQTEAQARRAWQRVSETGHLTRGGLEAARIFEADDDGNPIVGVYDIMYCMFNPVSYKIKKSTKFTIKGLDEDKNYNVTAELDKLEPRLLTIKELWFDTTHEIDPTTGESRDVSEYTNMLVEFAETTAAKYESNFKSATTAKAPPPKVAFKWGSFLFLGVIESVKVKFTMFSPRGVPVRAKVSNLKLREFRHRKAYPRQNPSSGGGPLERVWRVSQGQRLDMIAAMFYGDATQWRVIAEHNQIMDPMALKPGQLLRIPPAE